MPGTDDLIGGRYRLDDMIGVGGAGHVFRAFDELTEQPVAVKLLGGSMAESRPRVRREIAALRLLRIPGVVRLLDEGRSEGRPYLVMELVEGAAFPGDDADGPRSWEELRNVALALLEIVAQVHAAGVVHRDLKPQNVLVDPEGRPTVLDFGLSAGPSLGARITQDGTILGTLEYLSPEQCRGEPPDARSDLYAFGVMLFHALTGRFPHDRDGASGIIQAKLSQRATPVRRWAPDLPGAVANAVDRLLATAPKDRPRSADDVFVLLHGEASPRGARRILPWLGGTDVLDSVTADLLGRRSVDVVGGPGAGRSRLVREVIRRLEDAGAVVLTALPGGRARSWSTGSGSAGRLGPLRRRAFLGIRLWSARLRGWARADAAGVVVVEQAALFDQERRLQRLIKQRLRRAGERQERGVPPDQGPPVPQGLPRRPRADEADPLDGHLSQGVGDGARAHRGGRLPVALQRRRPPPRVDPVDHPAERKGIPAAVQVPAQGHRHQHPGEELVGGQGTRNGLRDEGRQSASAAHMPAHAEPHHDLRPLARCPRPLQLHDERVHLGEVERPHRAVPDQRGAQRARGRRGRRRQGLAPTHSEALLRVDPAGRRQQGRLVHHRRGLALVGQPLAVAILVQPDQRFG